MRKLILKMSVTIDGFVAGPNRELDWVFRSMDETATAWTVASISEVGVHIMGSRTFRDMAAYWPSSTEPFAPPMNEIPKIVFSRSGRAGGAGPGSTTRALDDARAHTESMPRDLDPKQESWNAARVATGDLEEEIARLKQEPGRDILAHGGASFAQALVKTGLIDEYRLLVHPVAIGRGLPLFSSLTAPIDLRLVEAKAFAGGTVAHVYRPSRV